MNGFLWFIGVRERKKGREGVRKGRKKGGDNKWIWEGDTALGILTLKSPCVDILLLFISGVSLKKNHECSELNVMTIM